METGSALALVPEHQAALFDTSKPDLVIDKAQGIAVKLTDIVEKAHLFSMISGRKYVKVEGWTTMLAMLGVFPHVEYCRKRESDVIEYEARVELRTMDGKPVGSGEALCSAVERNWSGRDEFAIKSMAQTRATGKAARNAFSWIMALAGYEATPAEEMPHDEAPRAPQSHSAPASKPTEPQKAELHTSRFTQCEMLTVKSGDNKGKGYWVTLDDETSRFFIFEAALAAKINENIGKQLTVEIETSPKGTKILGVI